MTIQMSTLRPGYLVSLSTSVTGNVYYEKQTIQEPHRIRDGSQKAAWKTERTIKDPVEHKKASQTRMKCRQIISSVCSISKFGLLCREDAKNKLDEAVEAARKLADKFNLSAQHSHVSVYVMAGKVARDDVEAVRAINSEVRGLMKEMQQGTKELNAKKVRDAANRLRSVDGMLAPDASEKAKAAVVAARSIARKIVAAGDAAAQEIDEQERRKAVRQIEEARTAFLDLDDSEATTSVEATAGRDVDFGPAAEAENSTTKSSAKRKSSTTKKAAKRPVRRAARQLELILK